MKRLFFLIAMLAAVGGQAQTTAPARSWINKLTTERPVTAALHRGIDSVIINAIDTAIARAGSGSLDTSAVVAIIRDSLLNHYTKAQVDTLLAQLWNDVGIADSSIIDYLTEQGGGGGSMPALKKNAIPFGGTGGVVRQDSALFRYDSATATLYGGQRVAVGANGTELDDGSVKVSSNFSLYEDGAANLEAAGIPMLFLGASKYTFARLPLVNSDSLATQAYVLAHSGGGWNVPPPLDSVLMVGSTAYRDMTIANAGSPLDLTNISSDGVRVQQYPGTTVASLTTSGVLTRSLKIQGEAPPGIFHTLELTYGGPDISIDAGLLGTVKSMGLAMPSAFTVSGSPITAAGTITVNGNGTSAQYITGTGALATFAHTHDTTDVVGLTGSLAALRAAIGSGSQWTTSGSDVYRANGKVGIGTTTPHLSLEVNSAVDNTTIIPYGSGQSGSMNNTFTLNGAISVLNYNYAQSNNLIYQGYGGAVSQYGAAALHNMLYVSNVVGLGGSPAAVINHLNIVTTSATNLYNVYLRSQVDAASTITNYYSLFINNIEGSIAGITNLYGIYQTQAAAKNYFAGKIIAGSAVKLAGYTVATLPTGTVGDIVYVTDALSPANGTPVVGGGAVVRQVFFDGTNWIIP